MTPEQIERLSQIARNAGLSEIELTEEGTSLRLRLVAALPRPAVEGHAVSRVADAQAPTPSRRVRSPGVGLFHHRHPLTGCPASEPGQRVARGELVGFIVIGPCVRPVIAPDDGVIGAPACEDGVLVGYGTLLYPVG